MKKIFTLSVLTKEPVESATIMKGLTCSSVLICRFPDKLKYAKNKSFINCANLRSMHNCV